MSEELKACGEFIQAAMDGDDAQCERLFQQDAVVHAIATWGVRRIERRILGTCDFDLHPHYETGRGTSCRNWKPSISPAPLGTSLPETAKSDPGCDDLSKVCDHENSGVDPISGDWCCFDCGAWL